MWYDLYVRALSHVAERHFVDHVSGFAVSIEVKVDSSIVSVRNDRYACSTWVYRQPIDQLSGNGDHPHWRIWL